jgi:hypothetical protein
MKMLVAKQYYVDMQVQVEDYTQVELDKQV